MDQDIQNTDGPSSPSKRARVSLACQRCKRRKQRCDGLHPVCRSCQKANAQCLYERVVRPRYPGGKSLYIKTLEDHIAFLEAHMPGYGEDHLSKIHSGYRQQEETNSRFRDSSMSPEEQSSLVDGVAYLSLCASGAMDTHPEPFYVGSSSGATIARMIPSSIFHQSKNSRLLGGRKTNVLRPAVSHSQPAPSVQGVSSSTTGSAFPVRPQAQILFGVFFDRLHTRWPILDRAQYRQLFDRQYNGEELSIVHSSSLHLMYAISARFLQLTKANFDTDPEHHFAAAIERMDYILEQHNLATVQFLILLAVYGRRLPYGAGSWSQVRFAITLCIELGLHRKRASANVRDLEIRCRAFWACYCLDRETSLLLGRTFAIADRDINVELPSDNAEFWDLASPNELPTNDEEAFWSNVSPFVHIIKLRQIQSKMHRTLFRVDKDIFDQSAAERERLDAKVRSIQAGLDEWAKAIPIPPKDAAYITWMYDTGNEGRGSREFFNLQYHKTQLTLFTAIVPSLTSSDTRLVAGARSATAVCTAYKLLNQEKILSYNVTALHSCFLAGLTLIYCLWRKRGLFSYDALEGIRACSWCLTIFGEKWPGAVKYRDIFDAVSGNLLQSCLGSRNLDGSEMRTASLVSLSHPAGPPSSVSGSIERGTGIFDSSQLRTFDNVPLHSEQRAASSNRDGPVTGNILQAVRETFMQVDEDATGEWSGWRIFNEMVQEDHPLAGDTSTVEAGLNWNESIYDNGPRLPNWQDMNIDWEPLVGE